MELRFGGEECRIRHIFQLPYEIVQHITSQLIQDDLINLTLACKLFYKMATRILYSKIYLNDSPIENSDVVLLASTWSWLKLLPKATNEEAKEVANYQLSCLLRSIQENPQLSNYIQEVRLNWDLDIETQKTFVSFITKYSKSLKIIENVTDPEFDFAIEENFHNSNLISLDLPPPSTLPSLDIDQNYLPNAQRYLIKRLNTNIKVMTLFMDPLLLFNNVVRPLKKLEIDSFKMHCRPDTYPPVIYNRQNLKFSKLSDIFDTKLLKTLTIISWYDHISPDRIYKFDQWSEFHNLEDITLIAVTYNDKKISTLLDNCYKLKRLKLDFSYPKRSMVRNSMVFKSIFNHRHHLQFLDIKLNLTTKIINMDIRDFGIVLKIACNCFLCQEIVHKKIFQDKILPKSEDYKIDSLETYEKIDFFSQLFESCLSPYSKAVDRYPSVKTGPDNIEEFLHRFNIQNIERSRFFKPLNVEDFYNLFHCLVHCMKVDLDPIVENFKNLNYLVINDISLLIKEDFITGIKYPIPIFYNKGYKTNYEVSKDNRYSNEVHNNGTIEPYERSLYLN
ncbi:F-box protein [Wickerhamomyces ciferrii]|uniref:F-box protein n=1 Tax=Wickerhamomyces ciferrii (strain ATCC 14091 / BCRC 22168 / CBS 111 / JCM 3599 / NBRC 0793 / NRRL Y-1031 F-60-10) TaxID=1206466 RepID=K0KUQ0_WICCF|nr:F-box protein [Wickerhamomyces ciferrii]CCH45159.1 F-box protein [Wickerhamomyces ciferrii]